MDEILQLFDNKIPKFEKEEQEQLNWKDSPILRLFTDIFKLLISNI